MSQRTCSVDECDRPHWARGYCSTHYSVWYRSQPGNTYERNRNRTGESARRRAKMSPDELAEVRRKDREAQMRRRRDRGVKPLQRKPPKLLTPCPANGCSELAKNKFCSSECANSIQGPRFPKRRPVWRMGFCDQCGTGFVTQNIDLRCSPECQERANRELRKMAKERRRARKREAYVADVYRAEIFERDDFTCQLCGELLDVDEVAPSDWSPVIDHVVPLAKGGTHEPGNVQAAHFWCNCVKSDGEFPLAV